jgi:acetyl-CoA carboxylase biotin carboxyl carrier protein
VSDRFRPVLAADLVRQADGRVTLTAPAVGLWRNPPAAGTVLGPGSGLGELEILGVLYRIEIPAGAHGQVQLYPERPSLARRPVSFGEALAVLDPQVSAGASDVAEESAQASTAAGLVFRSPSSGRFYSRPAPDKPEFVREGDEISTGHTVALLEVMKTFNRIQYGGSGLPARAKVVRIVPNDQDDLSAGDPVLELEPA